LLEFLANPRYEVIPVEGIAHEILEHVPRGLTLTVTSSPKKGLERTLQLAEELTAHGFRAVPHIAAKLVVDDRHLRDILERLDVAGVREIFVVSGDSRKPAGAFRDSCALLFAIAGAGHTLDEIGITGYPDGHPFVEAETLMRMILEKQPLSSYVVTQISFDSEAIGSWLGDVRRRGVTLPVHIGVPGVVNRKRLLQVSVQVGVGESARFLAKHGSLMSRLLLRRTYTADALVEGLSPQLADPGSGLRGLHIYTFNEIGLTEKWRRETIKRLRSSLQDEAGGT